jgi:uncharacterized protein (DUF427 family)
LIFWETCLAKAIWDGAVVADSDRTVVVEGNVCFPSEAHAVCPWKGTASYRHVAVDGKRNLDAARFYPEPSAAAKPINQCGAFGKGVRIET